LHNFFGIWLFGRWCWKHLWCPLVTPLNWDGCLKFKHHEPLFHTHPWLPHWTNETTSRYKNHHKTINVKCWSQLVYDLAHYSWPYPMVDCLGSWCCQIFGFG
jgi:hypothetical protein